MRQRTRLCGHEPCVRLTPSGHSARSAAPRGRSIRFRRAPTCIVVPVRPQSAVDHGSRGVRQRTERAPRRHSAWLAPRRRRWGATAGISRPRSLTSRFALSRSASRTCSWPGDEARRRSESATRPRTRRARQGRSWWSTPIRAGQGSPTPRRPRPDRHERRARRARRPGERHPERRSHHPSPRQEQPDSNHRVGEEAGAERVGAALDRPPGHVPRRVVEMMGRAQTGDHQDEPVPERGQGAVPRRVHPEPRAAVRSAKPITVRAEHCDGRRVGGEEGFDPELGQYVDAATQVRWPWRG